LEIEKRESASGEKKPRIKSEDKEDRVNPQRLGYN